jgi:flagellar basal body-associated protein FliL
MNKKVLIGIAVALVIAAVGIIGVKAMLGDAKTEMPYEEQTEKTLNLQESPGATESGETTEAGENEANERQP